jgi:hypothetical protein
VFKHIAQVEGFLATCIAVYTWFTAPTTGLEGDVYFADFEVPPAITQQFRALEPLTAPSESRALFFKPSLKSRISLDTSGTVDQVLSGVASMANEKAPAIQHGGEYEYKSYWRITVRNTGSKSATSVALHLPMPASGVISRSRDRPIQDLPAETSRAFSLGNIQFGDEIVVHAWSVAPASAAEAGKISLTHDAGTGRVKIVR